MAKEKRPAMLFYGKDWYDDIHVQEMSYEEQGMYLRLCWLCWTEGRVPDDGERVARILKVDAPTFVGHSWGILRACFTITDGYLTHPKVERIRADVEGFSKQQSERSLKGWETRRRPSGEDTENAGPMPEDCRRRAQANPSSVSASSFAKTQTDLDSRPLSAKNADKSGEKFPGVRTIIRDALGRDPSQSVLCKVMDASAGASEADVVRVIRDTFERGYGPNSKRGPRYFKWFETVVHEHFHRGETLRPAAPASSAYKLDDAEFERMSVVLDSTEGD